MRRDFEAYLCDIYTSAEKIKSYTHGFDAAMFADAPAIQDAVLHRLQIIGEAVNQCKRHHAEEVVRLGDVQGVVDFRNHLVHRYHDASDEIVWDILMHDLPSLVDRVTILLQGVECR